MRNKRNVLAIIIVFVLFIVITIAKLFFEFPATLNNIIFGLCFLGAVYVFVWTNADIGNPKKELKKIMQENREKKDKRRGKN